MSFKNLIDLIKDAHLYQYANIADSKESIKKKKPLLFFTKHQWFIVVLSLLMNVVINNGYSIEFCGYVIAGLSLFLGLFFNFIIALYGNFSKVDFSIYQYSTNSDNYPLGVRLKNYYKKTTVLSLYLVILSIISILLLSCTLLFESILNQLIDFNDICQLSVCEIAKIIGIVGYRSLVFYFLVDFVMVTIYLTASIYDFIISEYNKVSLK